MSYTITLTNILIFGIAALWFIPAYIQSKRNFIFKDFFLIIGLSNLIPLTLYLFGIVKFNNTIYHVAELLMLSVFANPRSKLSFINHSYTKFILFSLLILFVHSYLFYFSDIPKKYDALLSALIDLVMIYIILVACFQRLTYSLNLNIFILFILTYALFNLIYMLLLFLGFYVEAYINSIFDIILISYFSVADYHKSRPLFKIQMQ